MSKKICYMEIGNSDIKFVGRVKPYGSRKIIANVGAVRLSLILMFIVVLGWLEVEKLPEKKKKKKKKQMNIWIQLSFAKIIL